MATKDELRLLYLHYRENLRHFAEDFLESLLTNKIPPFHKEIYKALQTKERLAVAAPRGFAKSYICSFIYPLHCALFQKKKDICIISASESLAIEWLRHVRTQLESNQKIISFFGDLKSSKWTETHLILSNGVQIRAKGAGAQIRGFRPDLVILDDVETDESVLSEEQRNKLRDWIFKACLNTLLPQGQFIMIGTIIHPLALLNEILKSDNAWEKKLYKAYRDGIQEIGYELWPDLWTHDRLQARKKEIGSFAFASEYLNDPIASETAPIKENQIRVWEVLPPAYNMVISIDPAYSEEDRADFKVASVIAVDPQANRYLASYLRTHKPTGEFMDGIINLYLQHKDKVIAVGCPNGGPEKEFYQSLIRKCNERHIYPPIVELKNTFTDATDRTHRKKTSRVIASLQPLFEAGKYYIHSSHTEARDELLSIGSSRWDDLVDSMAYAEQLICPPSEEFTEKRGRYGEPLESEKPQMSFDYGYEL